MQTKLVKETIEEVTDVSGFTTLVSGTCNISTGGGQIWYFNQV